MTYVWTDTARAEKYGNTPGRNRKILVQVWYPAEKPHGALPQRWLESTQITRAMAGRDNLPAFLLDQVILTSTHTYADAEILRHPNQYPVIIYIHGWAGFRNINQDQIESLVSNGYVVISANHTYGALITLFPNGDVAYNDPRALNGDGTTIGKDTASNQLVRTFADDVSFILEKVEQLNINDPDNRFTGQLDLDSIGVFGHSTGGGAAVQFCATDSRCKAVLGMDTWVEPVDDRIIQEGFGKPLMVINSESWKNGPNRERLRELYDVVQAKCYWLDIASTKHYDFVMVPTFSPIAHILGFSGSLPAKEIMTINNTYLVGFFDRHLRNQSVDWITTPSGHLDAVSFEFKSSD
jgi:acetyl esterase/lipase